jgi:glycosyltransferase involved in cell wall biosynthesis
VSELAGKTLAIATHVYGSGPADALEVYARERADTVLVLRHAFSYASRVDSVVRRWEAGKLVHERRVDWHARVPEPITWTKDFFLDLVWAGRQPAKLDAFIGIDSLNAAAGLVLRRAGKAQRVVFWTIDFVPERFPNRLLNDVYHRFDRLCVQRCDETWNVSSRIEAARRERGVFGRQRIVPIGAYVRSPQLADPQQAIFVGHLLEKQGVQLALRALPHVRERVPVARLLVVGDGPYRPALESLARELGLGDAVEFAGYVEDHGEVEELIAKSAVGLAVYDPSIASFTEFADPGKIKNYLAAGVPVVTTPVVHSAAELERSGAGAVVDYDVAALAEALAGILGDPALQRAMSAAAVALGAEADWTAVFDRAFAGLASDDVQTM